MDISDTTTVAAAAPVASTSTLPPPNTTSTATTASSVNRQRTHVQHGDSVLLQLPSKNIKVFKLVEGANIINLGKYGAFDARTELIGRPYGVTLEIVSPASTSNSPAPAATGSTSVQEDGDDASTLALQEDIDEENDDDTTTSSKKKNNNNGRQNGKGKQDTRASQPLCTLRPYEETTEEIEVNEATNENILATGAKTLSHQEIMELKKQGIDGREMIARQIAEHEAFELKNAYSKAKYQKRKESKYLKYFTLLPSTMYNICKFYFENEGYAKKIRDLRYDTLAQIVTLANIRPGSRVVVVDDAGGIVVGAIAERMAGQGVIFQLHQNDSPPANTILPLFNLPSSYTSPDVFKALHFGWTDNTWEPSDSPIEDNVDDQAELTEKQKYRALRRKAAREALLALVSEFKEGGFDALVVCSQYEPMSVLKRLLPVLGGSAQIVIHSPTIQPLSNMLQALLPLETVLNPTITEPWIRQYQVLPGRTHPEMNGIAHGGYLLHATKVIVDDVVEDGQNVAIGKGIDRRNNKRRKR